MNITAETSSETDAAPSRFILVADDDPDIREMNASALAHFGYQVDTAVDGADAWIALQRASYDLLITDHKMPRMTGVELIQKARSHQMGLAVILMSGTMPREELERHPELKLDATLTKPFTLRELVATVKTVLCAEGMAAESPQLFLDYGACDDKIPSAEKSRTAPTPRPTSPLHRILVVDDDNDMRQFSVDLLSASGYHVEGVKDGAAGWEALQVKKYDLVVTDNKMPNMTGVEMISKLRSARMTIPVIMATGVLPMNEFARRPWLKPDAMLQRPFASDALLKTVKEVLRADDGSDSGAETLLPAYL